MQANTIKYELIVRQNPVHSRMCGVGEKVDRRPLDPPPIVQVKYNADIDSQEFVGYLNLFLVAILVPAPSFDNEYDQFDIHFHSRMTVGRTVSSVYSLRDLDGEEGAYFVFPNISIRQEGRYRLKMCLFDMTDMTADFKAFVFTEPFQSIFCKNCNIAPYCNRLINNFDIYSSLVCYRSCSLIQHFAEQGLKVRVRRDCAPRGSKLKKENMKQEHDYDNSSLDDDKSTGTDIADRPSSYEGDVISPLKHNFQKRGMIYESRHSEYESRRYETYASSSSSSISPSNSIPYKLEHHNEVYRRTSLQLGDSRSRYYEHDDEAYGIQLSDDKMSKKRRLSLSYLLDNHNSQSNLTITLPPPTFDRFAHKSYSLYYRDTIA